MANIPLSQVGRCQPVELCTGSYRRPEATHDLCSNNGSNLLEKGQDPRLRVQKLLPLPISNFHGYLKDQLFSMDQQCSAMTRDGTVLPLRLQFPTTQVKNLTFGGGKELQRRDRACSESQKIHAEVGCNQVTNLAVAVAIRQWHRHDPM